MALAAWLVYFMSTTPASYGISVISTKLVLEEQWNEGIIGLVSSGNSLVIMLSCMPGSMMIRKKNVRHTIIVGTFIGSVAYGVLVLFPITQMSYILMVSLSGVAVSFGGLLVGPSLINAWFDRNKALPMAFVMSAGGVGGFLMPVIARYLASINIKLCWLLYFTMMVSALLLGTFVVRDTPDMVSEVKDGVQWVKSHPRAVQKNGAGNRKYVLTLKECYASHRFWMMSVQTFCIRVMWSTFMSYAMYYAIQKGGSTVFAAGLLSVANIGGFTFRCLSGLSGHLPFSKNTVVAMCFTIIATGSGLLVISSSMTAFLIGTLLIGSAYGFMIVYFPLLVSDSFGSHNFVMLNGVFNTINCAGLAVGPVLAFTFAKIFGGYDSSFMLTTLLMILSAVLAVIMAHQKTRKI